MRFVWKGQRTIGLALQEELGGQLRLLVEPFIDTSL